MSEVKLEKVYLWRYISNDGLLRTPFLLDRMTVKTV